MVSNSHRVGPKSTPVQRVIAQYIKKSSFANLRQEFRKEGLSIESPLFHSTKTSLLRSILSQGIRARAGDSEGDAYHANAVSLSRNLDFLLNTNYFGKAQVILVLDRSELKQRFKLHSYDWYNQELGRANKTNPNFEYEERVTRTRKYDPQDLLVSKGEGILGF